MHCSRNGRPSLGYTAPQITLGPGHENFISAVCLSWESMSKPVGRRHEKQGATTTTVEFLLQRRQLPGWTLARDGGSSTIKSLSQASGRKNTSVRQKSQTVETNMYFICPDWRPSGETRLPCPHLRPPDVLWAGCEMQMECHRSSGC